MRSTFTLGRLQVQLTLLALLCSLVAGQDINPVLPEDLTQCQTSTLSWSSVGTDTIYSASIILADTRGQMPETTLTPLGRLTDQTSVEWDVAFPAGYEVLLRIAVENRTLEYSNPVVIGPGSDACLPNHYYDRIGSHGGLASNHGTGMVNGSGKLEVFNRTLGWSIPLLLLSRFVMSRV